MANVLLRVEPMGLGTVDIESITSYVARLAQAHSTSIPVLLSTAVRRTHQNNTTLNYVCTRPISESVRPTATAANMVETLAEATGTPRSTLQSMTFLALRGVVSRWATDFSQEPRWCPLCLEEWRIGGTPQYFKLQWQLRGVESCPIHRCQLQNRCPSCGATQNSHRGRQLLGYCSSCTSTLSSTPSSDTEASMPSGHSELIQLVEHIATHPGQFFPASGTSNIVRSLYDEAWRKGTLEDMFTRLSKNDCRDLVYGMYSPSLSLAVHVSRSLGIPLVRLLLGNIEGVSFPLFPSTTRS